MNSQVKSSNKAPSILFLFFKNPAGFIWRGFYKICIGPFIYGRGDSYKSSKFWEDRFSKYGLSLKGSGDEGFSELENKEMYERAAQALLKIGSIEKIHWPSMRVLDIGCGTGFYTQLLEQQGVQSYVGVDVTDVLFSQHAKNHPNYKFIKKDITTEVVEAQFDVVIMLDVIQSIVTEKGFINAMLNVGNTLAENGVFIVAPIMPINKKHIYYMHFWTKDDIMANFKGWEMGDLLPFRNDFIGAVRKNRSQG